MITIQKHATDPEPRRSFETLVVALIFSLSGLILILASLGIIPGPEAVSRREAVFDTVHHWQITSFGIMFFSAGLSVATPPRYVGMRKLASTVCALAFIVGCIGVLAYVRSR